MNPLVSSMEEQSRNSLLIVEKQELEEKDLRFYQKDLEAMDEVANKELSKEDKDRFEKQLHDMAIMVERRKIVAETSMEIDSQSSEIERLLRKNYNISASYEEATAAVVVQWRNQVLKFTQMNICYLRGNLQKNKSRAEELSAEVMKLSAQLQHDVQAYNGLARMYKPVFRNIESSLMKMKQDGSVTVQ
ncbi:hypothetical protein IFM89_011948 [Coptis chinensis]|uniref:Uncharacterized protein n=1 Tax=Coptis chinensis TaxID=261450 RepID=A0A835H4L9_9MAGN|nr:hypothetical protein IFM89_011948 [Coptis chinensis]